MTVIDASFSIWSKTISPDAISEIVGVQADKTALRGAERVPPRGVPVAHGWHIILRDEGEIYLEDTLSKLMTRVEKVKDMFARLRQEDPESIFRIAAILSPSPSRFSLYLSQNILKRMTDTEASLDIVFEDLDAVDDPKESLV